MSLPSLTIDNHDTYEEWGLFIVTKSIGAPTPKVYTIDIPGGNGVLDITESLMGDVAYNNREITVQLRGVGRSQSLWAYLYTEILNAIHGKRCQIIFSDELSYYYMGRISITSFHYNRDVGEIELSMDCDPFKYEFNTQVGTDWLWDPFDFETSVITEDSTITINNSKTISLTVKKMPVTPTFFVTGVPVELQYGTLKKSIPINREMKFYDLVLTEGTHNLLITCSGTAKMTVTYTNGVL